MPRKIRKGSKEPREKKVTKIKKKIREIPVFWRNIVILAITGVLAGLIAFGTFGAYVGVTVMFFGTSIPISVYVYKERKRIDDIEKHLPDFLRDLAEYNTSGLPLTQAVLQASKTDYGALTPEVKKIAAEISWGVPFEEALKRFQRRVKSPFVDKAVTIMTTAEEQGGEITAILRTLAEDLRKLKEMEEERKGKLSVYTATIYVIFLLLLGIMIMLTSTLAPAIPKMQVAGQFFGTTSSGLTETDFRTLLFHVSLIEAFFAGLISGQMGEGSVLAGIKHSVILVGITLLAFSLVHPAPPIQKIAETITEIPPVEGVTGSTITYSDTFTTGFTTVDVAEKVREIAKERGRDKYKGFKPDQVQFVVVSCTPCEENKIKIEPNKITVIKPAKLAYTVRYGKGKYIVEFRDAK